MKKFLVLSALLVSLSAHAEFVSGLDLLKSMNSDRTFALGYVAGVTDSVMGIMTCPPKNIKLKDIMDVTLEFMSVNQEKLESVSGDIFVTMPMSQKFPCAKSGKTI